MTYLLLWQALFTGYQSNVVLFSCLLFHSAPITIINISKYDVKSGRHILLSRAVFYGTLIYSSHHIKLTIPI